MLYFQRKRPARAELEELWERLLYPDGAGEKEIAPDAQTATGAAVQFLHVVFLRYVAACLFAFLFKVVLSPFSLHFFPTIIFQIIA